LNTLDYFATLGYAVSFLLYLALCVQLTVRSLPGLLPRAVWIAALAMVLWSLARGLHAGMHIDGVALLTVAEILRDLAWLIIPALAISELRGVKGVSRPLLIGAVVTVILVGAPTAIGLATRHVFDASTFAKLLVAAAAIGLCEQALRSSVGAQNRALRYTVISIIGIFLFDFVSSMPLEVISSSSSSFEAVRGFNAAFFSIPLFLAARNTLFDGSAEQEYRRPVYYTFSAVTLALVLIGLLIGESFISGLEGEWPTVLWMLLIAASVATVALLAVSDRLRSRIRVFLTKSFLPYKYDYRKEWLRFIKTLSETPPAEDFYTTSIRAIAAIVSSPGGVVWLLDRDRLRYSPVGVWRLLLSGNKAFEADSSLVRFMTARQWVIDLSEMQRFPRLYEGLELDAWFRDDGSWWIIVPLLLGEELYGFVALAKPPAVSDLNFEDHDLLKTVGRHVATHLRQAESDKQLAEAQQFGAYHRLSAFLMHDLNNLVAQQSLVVQNAERHKHDPRFFDDTIATIANSVSRMNRLLEQLSKASEQPSNSKICLRKALQSAVDRSRHREPRPSLECSEEEIVVSADAERLSGVFEHLIRNAQDATDTTGSVQVALDSRPGGAFIEIRDTGCGMTEEFIGSRLFKPFDSTKGSQSMGIGAYQAREYIRNIGGKLEVVSQPGSGTSFTISLPTLPGA
jgi:putative PEP-CTERM system histidine kinase